MPARRPDPACLRVALLGYRADPRCGGQGVYLRHLSRELTNLGHDVTVFAGPPYPDLDSRVALVRVPSLQCYVAPGPFKTRAWARMRTRADLTEFGLMFSGQFSEPLAFSQRIEQLLGDRHGDFDVVHDNQTLGRGLLGVARRGTPVVATIHHPLTVDRQLALDHISDPRWRASIVRWYRFVDMQMQVARKLPAVLTVSEASRRDIVEQMGADPTRVHVVPAGADPDVFRPRPHTAEIPGRLITTASADGPLKGLVHLLEAVAKLRTERPDVQLTVIGRAPEMGPAAEAMAQFDLHDIVRFTSGITDDELVAEYARAQVAVVPSLYEGFGLPVVEAMATATPVVTTTGGALPEVAGPDGGTGRVVAPGDAGALAQAIAGLLDDPGQRVRAGAAGRERVLRLFTWERCARATAEHYRRVVELR
jgi:glycosyltransferase involved in cell wall biosynthesis